MSRKKISTTIYITPEQADRLKLLHERTKVPISVYIREGIDMMLKHYEHVLPGQMSLDAASPSPPPVAAAPGPSRREPANTLRTGFENVPAARPSTSGEAGSSAKSPGAPREAGARPPPPTSGPTRSGEGGG